jgi:hypothetical protein
VDRADRLPVGRDRSRDPRRRDADVCRFSRTGDGAADALGHLARDPRVHRAVRREKRLVDAQQSSP